MENVCKLTGSHGKFVKCHILPKALTKPAITGKPFIQGGTGLRPVRRWSSWYDQNLVTRDGENILSDLDDWAIKFFRRERLVWSGWGPLINIYGLCDILDDTNRGIREIELSNPKRLQLFILSILWRAAMSNMDEFSEIQISVSEIDKITSILLGEIEIPSHFFNSNLIQLSSRGVVHNQTPVAMEKQILKEFGSSKSKQKFFRFYIDGLIIHINKNIENNDNGIDYGDHTVGNSNKLIIITIPFESSFQYDNLLLLADTTKWSSKGDS